MIAVDTNLLVYAHREDSAWHDAAYTRIFVPPTPLDAALDQVDAWLESPGLLLLSEAEGYWSELSTSLRTGHIVGPHVHDARIAALCRVHGVEELWTADRDFGRLAGLTVRNPLVG